MLLKNYCIVLYCINEVIIAAKCTTTYCAPTNFGIIGRKYTD